ncbi:MAG: metallophosphoesterase [Spirochaetes bacterium]|nr:metallophosphoesterase [Spirochaetota bacterium]
MVYCCSDLHGYFDEFIKLLKKINFSSNDTMYILGDSIDRGPKPLELLKYIYEHDNIIPLMGNHEEFLLAYVSDDFDKKSDAFLWDLNGGKTTRLAIDKLRKNDPVLYKNIVDDMKTWQYYLVLEPYILSHAGYNAMKLKNIPATIESLSKMTLREFIWSRDAFFKHKGIDEYITIFGHTPVRKIRVVFNQEQSDNIWVCDKYKDKIGIDGGVAIDGQLNCVNLDTMEVTIFDPKKT